MRKNAMRAALLTFGLPALLYGAGLSMIQIDRFEFGVGFIAISFMLFLVLVPLLWIEWWQRLVGGIAGTALYMVTIILIFVAAPLELTLISTPGNYIGEVYGMQWNAKFWELRMIVANKMPFGYSDLDVFIRTDLLIADAVIFPGNKCEIGADAPSVSLYGYDKKGKFFQIPESSKQHVKGTVYRLHCEKVFPKSTLEIVLPIVDITPVPDRQLPPRWAIAKAHYYAGRLMALLPVRSTFGR